VLVNNFLSGVSSNESVTEVINEVSDLITLNGGKASLVKPLGETIALVISQFKPNLTSLEESQIQGNMSKIASTFYNLQSFLPQVTNISTFYSLMSLQEHSELMKSVQQFLLELMRIHENPSFGYEYFRRSDLTDRVAKTAKLGVDLFNDFENRDCKSYFFKKYK
jgi:hypothetical protein